jgi:hypothetical protein
VIHPVKGRMADSTRPELIPDKYALRPNGVLVYVDGDYKWPTTQVHRFPRHWGITTTGALDSAPHARVIDVERFDATPADVPEYAGARMVHNDLTIVYCSRSTIPLVIGETDAWYQLLWFISTLDGLNWTPQAMTDNISGLYGVHIDSSMIVAIQNIEGEQYDSSLMFGNPGWQDNPKE